MKHSIQNPPLFWKWEETPGHGYLHIPKEDLSMMPGYLQKMHPFEEDAAWAIPVYFFKDRFDTNSIKRAEKSFKDWHWKEYEKLTGKELKKGDSYLKDMLITCRKNCGRYVVTTAFGSWRFQVPKGFVYVFAKRVKPDCNEYGFSKREAEERSFLVKEERYNAREGSYFIDELVDIPFKASDDFYTWDEFATKTGCKERF